MSHSMAVVITLPGLYPERRPGAHIRRLVPEKYEIGTCTKQTRLGYRISLFLTDCFQMTIIELTRLIGRGGG